MKHDTTFQVYLKLNYVHVTFEGIFYSSVVQRLFQLPGLTYLATVLVHTFFSSALTPVINNDRPPNINSMIKTSAGAHVSLFFHVSILVHAVVELHYKHLLNTSVAEYN